MAVYVDQLKAYPDSKVRRVSLYWCHMTADSLPELHAVAEQIGLKRVWFQPSHLLYHCHYDLTPSRRAAAVALGAVEVNSLEFARRLVREGRNLIEAQP